jgi:hypothetical protein
MTVMSDHTDIIKFTDCIFDTVDAKDWDVAERLFAPTVDFDFTSLTSGGPAAVSNVQLMDCWRQGPHPGKKHSRGDESVRTHLLSS